jgi:hypothetical protein
MIRSASLGGEPAAFLPAPLPRDLATSARELA